ncbi:MAG: extracellular solute-binding protein [Clostridia bacterium]|nr:extracellular solute-binding protein [Clostridia bacterium]
MIQRSVKFLALGILVSLALNLSACNHVKQSLLGDLGYSKKAPAADTKSSKITLKLWHIWGTESDSNKKPFEKALDDWNRANPNVQIEADATETETYKTRIRTAIAVNEAPDIFYSWGAGFARPFVEAEKVLPLDDYIQDGTLDKLLPGSRDNFIYDGKTYGLPIYVTAVVFYFNRELFEKNGVKIPETYKELLEAVKAFKAAGVTPMVVGEKDRWPGMLYQNILAIRTAGTKLCNQALNKQASFNQPQFVESAAKLNELVKVEAFDKRSMRLTAHEAELEFIRGKAAMYFNGSWSVGSLEKEGCPVKGKIVVRNFPVLENSGGDPNGFLGGAIDTFMINAGTQYKEEAVRALKTIDENFCRESYLIGASQPAWKLNVDESALSPLVVEISKLLKGGTGFVLAWDTSLSGSDAETHKDLIAELFAGIKTPQEFARDMQKLNEKKESSEAVTSR